MSNLSLFQKPMRLSPFFSEGQSGYWRSMLRTFDDLLAEANAPAGNSLLSTMPRYEFKESGNRYLLEIEIPGIKEDEIKLEFEKGAVLVSAKNSDLKSGSKGDDSWSSSSRRHFEATFAIPNSITKDQIDANYANGVLTLSMPREEASTREPIQIGSKNTTH